MQAPLCRAVLVWSAKWRAGVGGGVSLDLKCNDVDHGQTRPLLGAGLFEERDAAVESDLT